MTFWNGEDVGVHVPFLCCDSPYCAFVLRLFASKKYDTHRPLFKTLLEFLLPASYLVTTVVVEDCF